MNINIIDKKISKYLAITIIITLLVFGFLLYYIYRSSKPATITAPGAKPVERDMNKILESLSAPSKPSKPLPQKVQDSLSASQKGERPSEDVLKSLTAPKN